MLRRSKYFSLFLLCISVVGAVSVAPGQSGRRLPSSNSQKGDEPLRLTAEEVLLNVTITDDYGRQVTSLRRDDFIVAEDGQRQEIAGFQIATVPINVVLLLDASGSIINDLQFLRDAATRFVEALGPEDKVSVIEFHSKVELIQDWTSNAADLRHAISWRYKPGPIPKRGGNTSLNDALYLAAEDQLAKVEGRKAIIVLTDGVETSSKLTFDQALAATIKSGAVVYVISKARALIAELREHTGAVNKIFGGGIARQASLIISELERAEERMTLLCSKTGGRLFSPLEDKEMADVYAKVASELKNQYVITYAPKNKERDGRLRHINVYLRRPGYIARTRDSYYAPKD